MPSKYEPVFYLKVNRTTEEALRCFWHWVDIIREMGADFYVVCDKDELTERLINDSKCAGGGGTNCLKVIPSSRERLKDVMDGLFEPIPKWVNIGNAMLTPFLHAKEKGYDNFWNVDADDSMMLCDAKTCAKALRKASDYADENKVYCLSLDFTFSIRFHNIIKANPQKANPLSIWNFGCTYTKNLVDYLELLKNSKKLIPRWKEEGKGVAHNIDAIFKRLAVDSLIKAETFYIENMGFNHDDKKFIWRSDLIFLLYMRGNILTYLHIDNNGIVNGMPICPGLIKINVGISENRSKEWCEKNQIENVYFDKEQMIAEELGIILRYAKELEKRIAKMSKKQAEKQPLPTMAGSSDMQSLLLQEKIKIQEKDTVYDIQREKDHIYQELLTINKKYNDIINLSGSFKVGRAVTWPLRLFRAVLRRFRKK